MATREQVSALAGGPQVVLVLRLVPDRRAQLHHGELVDAGAVDHGRLQTLAGLAKTLTRWLEREQVVTGA